MPYFFLHVHFLVVKFSAYRPAYSDITDITDQSKLTSVKQAPMMSTHTLFGYLRLSRNKYFVAATLFRSKHVFCIPSFVAIRNFPSLSSKIMARRFPRPLSIEKMATKALSPTLTGGMILLYNK